MKRFRNLSFIITMALSRLSVLSECGGGGVASTSRQGGTDASLTATNTTAIGDAIGQAVKLVAPAAALREVKAASDASEKVPPLISILMTVEPIASNQNANGKQSTPLSTEQCQNGGNIELTSLSPLDLMHTHAEVSVHTWGQRSVTLNGLLQVTFLTSELSDLQHVTEFTITTPSFTYVDSNSGDKTTLASNSTMVFSNISYSGNSDTGGSVTMGGILTGALAGESIKMECDSFSLAFCSSPTDVAVSVSDGINASCLNGWVTMSTNSPAFLSLFGGCPIGGQIVVSAGGNTVSAAIAADTSMVIAFNNTIVQTPQSCTDVKGLNSG